MIGCASPGDPGYAVPPCSPYASYRVYLRLCGERPQSQPSRLIRVHQIWNEIPDHSLACLYDGMTRCVMREKGYPTKYQLFSKICHSQTNLGHF